jgi:hypothetical protein
MKKAFFLLILILNCSVPCLAGEFLVQASGSLCKKGLYQQPNGGPFTVWLFCDDALGANIGVINSSDAAGPGNIPLPPSREWANWQTNDRFWQDPAWATDITSFAWSPDLKFLYVATDSIYGSGDIYRLDLINRKAFNLKSNIEKTTSEKIYSTRIKAIDQSSGVVTIELFFASNNSELQKTKEIKLK